MATIKIFAVDGIEDGARCIVALTDEGFDLLKSIQPVTAPIAAATAKILKFRGAVAPLSDKPSESDWFTEKQGEDAVLRFGPVVETSFETFSTLEMIQSALKDARIEWDPPELDPSADVKKEDTTKTQGIDGS